MSWMGFMGGIGGCGGLPGRLQQVMELLVWKSEGDGGSDGCSDGGGGGGRGVGHEIALKDPSSPMGILEVPCLIRTFVPCQHWIFMQSH